MQSLATREFDLTGMPVLGRPVVVGLLGSGIQLSRTPAMHEAEGHRLGLRYIYTFLDTDAPKLAGKPLDEILWAVEAMGYSGLNVTFPYKQAILAHLDELSDNARRLGAVNTVVFRAGRRIGHNTDLYGFAEGFRRRMPGAALGSVLQLGAGGAGSAVARALMQLGVETLTICDLDADRSARLAQDLAADYPDRRLRTAALGDVAMDGFDGLVNTTPVGMAKSPGMPVPESVLRRDMWVADVIYFPLETELLATARQKGCAVMSGAAMAVFQAVRAFELFTGSAPDPIRMEETFNAFDLPGRATARPV